MHDLVAVISLVVFHAHKPLSSPQYSLSRAHLTPSIPPCPPSKKMSSSSPQIALTCSPDGHITAYTTSSATAVSRFSGSHSPRNGIAILGKKHIAASHVSGTGEVHLYNWWSSTPYHRISVPEPVAPLSATRDGRYLFAGGISGHIHAFSLPAGDLVRSFPAHSKPISCFEINGDGSLLISGNQGRSHGLKLHLEFSKKRSS